MACESSINIVTSVEQARALMLDTTIEGSHWIISSYHAFEVDREVGSFRQIHGADGVGVVTTVRPASCTGETLINIGLRRNIPSALKSEGQDDVGAREY